jgi:geranylgeranyl diphosphate synthase type I
VNLREATGRFLPLVEAELKQALAAPGATVGPLYGMLRYHMGWVDAGFAPLRSDTGKRLRPILTLLACQAAGGDPLRALPAAAAVEMVHNFSLIHDDIEDCSATRRHRVTVWKIWGEPQAINAGDALLGMAHVELSRLAGRGVPLPQVWAATRALQVTCVRLCQGQYLDMSFETRTDVDVEAYLEMIEGKTGALMSCAAELGALVAGAEEAAASSYRRFGLELGLAFQVQDDLLGIWGEEEATGKPIADDIRQRKKTLPTVFALNQGNEAAAERLRAIYAQEAISEEEVSEVLDILGATGARSYVEETAHNYYRRAVAELEAAGPEGEAGQALLELADFITQRCY